METSRKPLPVEVEGPNGELEVTAGDTVIIRNGLSVASGGLMPPLP